MMANLAMEKTVGMVLAHERVVKTMQTGQDVFVEIFEKGVVHCSHLERKTPHC